MRYADWKNDFTFYKLFGGHEDVLRELLNDLLGLAGEQAIAELQYLPRDQAPELPGQRRAIVDVKCREESGRVFIVEMQLFPHSGFVDRVVYNACRALVSQLSAGQKWQPLADVVAVAICDFEIWSDRAQECKGEPKVPLLSRWQMTEQQSGALGLGQVRYLFLELPKLGDKQPAGAAETWAWLFRKAPDLELAPEDVAEPQLTAAQRKALTLANVASFTEQEREVYERVRQEIWVSVGMNEQARAEGLAEGLAKGEAKGRAEGRAEGCAEGELSASRRNLRIVLASRDWQLSPEQEARIDSCTDLDQLSEWLKLAVTAGSIDEILG